MLKAAPLVLLLLSCTGHAEDRCPYMNAATVGGFLGGEVSTHVVHHEANRDDATCSFEVQRGNVPSRLRIDVTTMPAPQTDFSRYRAQCSAEATPLKAIGNEAFACEGGDQSEHWELVIGRVRDRAFTVRLTSSAPPADLRDKARKAAEQVAGILF